MRRNTKRKTKKGAVAPFFMQSGRIFIQPPVSYLDKADEIYYNKKLER